MSDNVRLTVAHAIGKQLSLMLAKTPGTFDCDILADVAIDAYNRTVNDPCEYSARERDLGSGAYETYCRIHGFDCPMPGPSQRPPE